MMTRTLDMKVTSGAQDRFKWLSDLMTLADSRNKARLLVAAMIIPVVLVLAAGGFFMSQTEVVQTRVRVVAEPPPPLDFKTARETANTEAMRHAIQRMWADGKIKKGMAVRAVIEVLGVPDNTTGIYLKKGFSIGYSSLKPSTENYDEFFWLHFRKDAKLNSSAGDVEVLVGWWDVRAH